MEFETKIKVVVVVIAVVALLGLGYYIARLGDQTVKVNMVGVYRGQLAGQFNGTFIDGVNETYNGTIYGTYHGKIHHEGQRVDARIKISKGHFNGSVHGTIDPTTNIAYGYIEGVGDVYISEGHKLVPREFNIPVLVNVPTWLKIFLFSIVFTVILYLFREQISKWLKGSSLVGIQEEDLNEQAEEWLWKHRGIRVKTFEKIIPTKGQVTMLIETLNPPPLVGQYIILVYRRRHGFNLENLNPQASDIERKFYSPPPERIVEKIYKEQPIKTTED